MTFPFEDLVRRDCYTVVESPTEQEARRVVVEAYGRDGFREVKASPPYSVDRMTKIELGQ